MAGVLGYIIALVFSLAVSTILLKFVIMKITNFYVHINIIIYVILILGIFLFFMPKQIVSQSVYTQVDRSCECTGYVYTNDYNRCIGILTNKDLLAKNPDVQKNGCSIKKDCFGIIKSCTTLSAFKSNAIKDIGACEQENDFYSNKDACFESAAREIATHAASGNPSFSFESAMAYCQKMTEPSRTQCIKDVEFLQGGGVLF